MSMLASSGVGTCSMVMVSLVGDWEDPFARPSSERPSQNGWRWPAASRGGWWLYSVPTGLPVSGLSRCLSGRAS